MVRYEKYYQKLDELKAKGGQAGDDYGPDNDLENDNGDRGDGFQEGDPRPDQNLPKLKTAEPPVPQTLNNWIHAARSHATVKSKWGTTSANRQLRGRGASLEAFAPLEVLVLDATVGDVWAVEELHIDGSIKVVLKRP